MAIPEEPTAAASAPGEKPFQFHLMHLLAATAIVAIGLGVVVGIPRAIQDARNAARESYCRQSMRTLAIALMNYHDSWNCFPPARCDDNSGKPMHSWRVLIAPYMDCMGFYKHYDFNEPWNGPTNSTLNGPWKTFICPSDSGAMSGSCNYVAIVGPGTMWPDGKSAKRSDLTDGDSNTLMIIEIAHSDIHWMEPRDLPVEDLAAWLDPSHRPRLLGNHIEGGLVAYADGHVEMLPRDVTIERLKALATAAGNDIEQGRAPQQP